MPKPRVYIETTIPSFYHTSRHSPAMLKATEVTRAWWARAAIECELLTGIAVLRELEASPGSYKSLRLELVERIEVLGVSPQIVATAHELIRHKVMPGEPSLDAHHLAIASHFGCEMLVTWDRKHLANPRKASHIRRVLDRLGLFAPMILTPSEHLERMR